MSRVEPTRADLQKMPHFRRLREVDPEEYVQTRMELPTSVIDRIDNLKKRHCFRNRQGVVAGLIRRAANEFSLSDFELPPEPLPGDAMQSTKFNLQAEHMEFLYRLQRRFRGAGLGVTLEAILATVGDLAPSAVQLSLVINDQEGAGVAT